MTRPDPRELLAVFAGGFVGAIARVALSESLPADPGHWPWATFAANITGALLLGYFGALLHERRPIPSTRLRFVGTGLCGALTTFSAMQLEILEMLDGAHYALAAAYALIAVGAGVAAVAVASSAGRRVLKTT